MQGYGNYSLSLGGNSPTGDSSLSNDQARAAAHLQSRIIGYLRKAGWGNQYNVSRRFNSEFREPKDGSELSYWMEDSQFDQALFRLPSCISFLRKVPHDLSRFPDEEDRETAVWQGSQGLSFFLSSHHPDLCHHDLWQPVLDAVSEMLTFWNGSFEANVSVPFARDGSEPEPAVVHFVPTATFLEELRPRIPGTQPQPRDQLFQRWAGTATIPESSANLLSLLLQIRLLQLRYTSLSREPLVLEAAFDAQLCQRHWTSAVALLKAKCPKSYIEYLTKAMSFGT